MKQFGRCVPAERSNAPQDRFGAGFLRFTPVYVQFVAFQLPEKVSLL
jgi:hypothetical protein